MRLSLITGTVLGVHAAAQASEQALSSKPTQFDALGESVTIPVESETEIETTKPKTSIASFLLLLATASSFGGSGSPTTSVIGPTTAAFSLSSTVPIAVVTPEVSSRLAVTLNPSSAGTTFATSTLRLSGILTVSITTDAIFSTVASTGSPTPTPAPPAAEAGSDRVAAITLGTILGALVFVLLILTPVILRRRKQRKAAQKKSLLPQNDEPSPGTAMRQRPSTWLGSLRRSAPRQQFSNPTGQPLMSEGEPSQDIPSQRTRRSRFPHAAVQQTPGQSQAIVAPDVAAVAVGSHPATTTTNPQQNSAAASPSYPNMGEVGQNQQRNLSDHDLGNPYVDRYPKTPEITQTTSQAQQQNDIARPDTTSPHQAALGSHPTRRTRADEQSQFLEVATDKDDQTTERSSSIPRDGVANAMAGLGIDPTTDPAEKDVSEQSVIAQPSGSANDDATDEASDSVPAELPTAAVTMTKPPSSRLNRKIHVPRLNIPNSLLPGRKHSKRTRFSIPGRGDVSPATESWLDTSEAEQQHHRRPSTVSPVSSDPGTYRTPPPVRSPQRKTRVKTSIDEKVTKSPAGTTSYSIPQNVAKSSRLSQGTPTSQKPIQPGINQIAQITEKQQQQQRQQQPPRQSRISGVHTQIRDTQAKAQPEIKRKPAPAIVENISRKPLPPNPPTASSVPTSRYNPIARQSTKPEPSQTSVPVSNYNPKRQSEVAQKSRDSHTPRDTRKQPTAYDEMVQGMSGTVTSTDNRPAASQDNKFRQPPTRAPDTLDSDAIISSYMQPSRESSVQKQTVPYVVEGKSKRDTVPFFEEPSNKEYAQLYGGYYSQPSPVHFKTPTSPNPLAHSGGQSNLQVPSQPQPRQQQTFLSPSLQPQPLNPHRIESRTGQPRTMSHRPRDPDTYAWRDSQQDAWRDSLSRSESGTGSAPASATGTNKKSEGGYSGGAGGTGLWGSPGFFGTER